MKTTQTKPANADATKMLEDARQRLERLSRDRLKVASDFLAYLDEREQSEATEELLSISGFEDAFQRAVRQVEEGQIVRFEDIQRDV